MRRTAGAHRGKPYDSRPENCGWQQCDPWQNRGMAALVVGAVAVLCAIAVASIEPAAAPTAYAAASPAARAALLVAGFSLILAGAVAATQRRTRRLGLLASIAAVAWLGPEIEGWAGGPESLRSLSVVAAPVLPALLLALAGAPRTLVAATAAAAAAIALAWLVLRDPFLDVYCWRTCGDNALLVQAEPGLVRALGHGWNAAVVATGVLVVVIAARRLAVAGPAARRALLPIVVAVAATGAAEAAYAGALLHTPTEDPHLVGFAAIHVVRAIALTALAGSVAWTVLERRRTRARVARLAAELGEAPAPGALRDTLAAALRDPAVGVLYWLPGPRRYVDAMGVAREPPRTGGVTRITRAGRLLAVVVHDPALVDARDLEREIGSAARLAVENEGLRAEVLAQLAALRASRARIVEAGDAARRRLERDLHDGAQQRLLAVALELKLARSGASGERAEALDAAAAEVDSAFGELRELAHGIYPAVLTEAGLEAALVTLSTDAAVAVDLEEVTGERFAPPIETGAYVTVAEAIRDAAARRASHVTVRVVREDGRLVLEARHDGTGDGTSLVHVGDRIGALGGVLEVGAAHVRAELPCGS
jgi:signal transduction histidine kinase